MSTSFVNHAPQFDGKNFSNWKFRVLILLEEKGVKCVLDPEFNKKDKTYKDKNSKAKSVIIQCLSDKYLEYVKDKDTAEEMLISLENVFERKSVFSKLYLKKRLLSMKFDGTSILEEHFVKFDSLVMTPVKRKVKKTRFVIYFLRCPPTTIAL